MVLPAVTWLLPVRNAMPYLRQTLASIAAQTYRHHQVLAWDNGSIDGSVQELQRWIPSRIPGRLITGRPMSLGQSLACMVDMSTELCVRIDGDDVNRPNRLEQQVQFMQGRPDILVLGSACTLIDSEDRVLDAVTPIHTDDADIRWMMRFGNSLRHPTVMFRRSAVLAAGNYRDLTPGQDYDLWLRMAALGRFANLDAPLVRYRIHDTSISGVNRSCESAIARQLRQPYLSQLFPGVDPVDAERLTSLVQDRARLDVYANDWLQWRAIAIRAACNAGESYNYFRRAATHRQQFNNLVTRWFKVQPGVSSIWPMARDLAHAMSFTAPVSFTPTKGAT